MNRVARGFSVGLVLAALAAEGGAPPGRYVLTTDTVSDTISNLTWQRMLSAASYTWSDAEAYCQGLSLAGLSGWRVPRIKELQTLVDVRGLNPSIDAAAFPDTPYVYFWTSSLTTDGTNEVWVVNFGVGNTATYHLTASTRVRCVR